MLQVVSQSTHALVMRTCFLRARSGAQVKLYVQQIEWDEYNLSAPDVGSLDSFYQDVYKMLIPFFI